MGLVKPNPALFIHTGASRLASTHVGKFADLYPAFAESHVYAAGEYVIAPDADTGINEGDLLVSTAETLGGTFTDDVAAGKWSSLTIADLFTKLTDDTYLESTIAVAFNQYSTTSPEAFNTRLAAFQLAGGYLGYTWEIPPIKLLSSLIAANGSFSFAKYVDASYDEVYQGLPATALAEESASFLFAPEGISGTKYYQINTSAMVGSIVDTTVGNAAHAIYPILSAPLPDSLLLE
jgi:hypothetical protein